MTSSQKNAKKAHIISQTFDIDEILSNLSKELFGIKGTPLTILALLGRRGSLTESELGDNTTVDRTSVARRIRNQKGLLVRGFIYESKVKNPKTKKIEKPFTLTFKGFLASLARITFEESFLIQLYKQYVTKFSDSQFADFAILYAKYNIAVILYWHKLNGLSLLNLNLAMNYLSNFSYRQFYDAFPIESSYVKDPNYLDEYIDLRESFLSLQIAMAKLLKTKEKNYLFDNYQFVNNNKTLHLYYSEELLYSVVKGWMHCLEFPEYLDPIKISLRAKDDMIRNVDINKANNRALKFLETVFDLKISKNDPILFA